jgi:tetratricopeptide (TPR) repeat protein
MNKLFLSYSWNDQKYADYLDSDLSKIGIGITRDIRDLDDYKSLKSFMQKAVLTSEYVVVLLSDSYLKSKNCMYEALQIYQDVKYSEKIVSIVLPDARYIYDPIERTKVVKYWMEKFDVLDAKVKELPIHKNKELLSDLESYDEIARMSGNFCSHISDRKNVSFEDLREQSYSPLLNYIGFDKDLLFQEMLRISILDDRESKEIEAQRFYEEHPKSQYASFLIGLLADENGYYRKAKEYYKKSMSVGGLEQARLNYANLLMVEFKEYDKAFGIYEKGQVLFCV